jgi:maleylpyruvate isomerase
MAGVIASDIHPLNNLRVLNALRDDFAATDAQVQAWIARWIAEGFVALERLVERHGGDFAFGDSPTLADCCLVPQVYSAERFAVDLAPFPRLVAIGARARALPAFAAAHPDRQPDADPPK